MALQCPTNFDIPQLRAHIRETYQRVANHPDGSFHFHRGPEYASRLLGYDAQELAKIPRTASDRFAGVGNPISIAEIYPGAIVLDHACGAGMDLLLAARRVGPTGRVIGIDMTPEMLERARAAAEEAGLEDRVELHLGMMEALPVKDASVDFVISNGVVNLSPDKVKVFAEIARVLRPGGRLMLADVIVARELSLDAREAPDLWAACVGGALQAWEFEMLAVGAGLQSARLLDRFDCYKGTSAEAKVSTDLQLGAVNFTAVQGQ
jgi:arsenite methyltransferase